MSANGYFDELEDSSDLIPLETEAFTELDPGKNNDLETFDAFNTDTFDCALEGDWEAEHDKLLELEGNDNLNNTLTKFDNAEDDDDLKREEDLEDDYLNGYTQTSGSNIRLDTNTIKQINQKSNLVANNNQSNVKLPNQDNRSLIEEQLKIFSQLQLQQQQQQQFHKSQQLMQQAQKQYQQQQLNSAMLAAAALSARNNQMQLQQNMMQKQQFNVMQNNSSSNIISNDSNRKTPISFNNNFNTIQANDKENSMYSYANQTINQSTFKNNENDSVKLKNLLEKINQVNLNPNRPASSEQNNPRRESPVQKQPIDSSIIQSILQSQNQYTSVNNANVTSPPNLPKLPAMKVKTLEEIENELLNQSQANSKPNNQNYSRNLQSDIQEMKNNQARMQQQQQPDMSKFFPLMNNTTTNNNPNSPNDMADKQKKLLEAIALHQYQQQIIKFQQQQQQQQQQNFQQNQQNPLMNQTINSNPNVDQQLQQQLVLIQQQLMSSQLNLNSLLPPNFSTLSQQQKQMVLNQIQRNLQASLLQQQLLQQQQQNGQLQRLEDQNKGFNNNNDLNNNSNHNEMNKFNNNNGDFNKRNMNNNNMNLNMNNMNHRQQQQNNQNRNDKDRKKQHINNNNMRNNNNNNNNGDKLAGMMTDKEKNWVVNVQMLQLQIDDPYRYDYYYTAWMLKKKQFSMRNNNSAGLKTSVLYQLMNKQDPKNYRPLTFENSLGKVTMSNFHHPRALIDLNQRDNQHESLVAHIDGLDEDEEKQKEAKNKDTILLEIEKIYQVLLSIDEIEHSILKAPEEMRILLFQERRAKVDKLALMLCTENFPHYLFVEKGRRLLAKSIPIFNLPQAKLILGFFMQYIYIISKNNIALDEIYSHISYAIDTQKFTDLVEIVNQFVHLYSRQPVTVYNTIFSNKFSLTFLLKFMSKSELINQDDYDTDIKAIWSCYLNLVLAGLTIINPVTIKPDGNSLWNISEVNQLNVKAILDNFSVDNDLWSKNEMKLKELFTII